MELVVAFAKNGIIGNDNKIPWNIPEDLIRFKHMTYGHVIVMGRTTFESLPNGPLKNRTHIVLTRNPKPSNIPDVVFVNTDNLRKTLEKYQKTKKIFLIGGREIYDLLFDYCEIFHITLVNAEPEGNVVFSYGLDYFFKTYTTLYSTDWFDSKNNGMQYKYYTFYKK